MRVPFLSLLLSLLLVHQFSFAATAADDSMADNFVTLTTQGKKTKGILAKSDGKTYVYVSQSSIFGLNGATIYSRKKKIISQKGFEIAEGRDLARIEVDSSETAGVPVTKLIKYYEELILYDCGGGTLNSGDSGEVQGLGTNNIFLSTKFKAKDNGIFLLNASGELAAIVGIGTVKIQPGRDGRPVIVDVEPLVARVDNKIEWKSIKFSKFGTITKPLLETEKRMVDYLDFVVAWEKTTHKEMEDNMEWDPDFRKMVSLHNDKLTVRAKILKRIKDDGLFIAKPTADNLQKALLKEAKQVIAWGQTEQGKLDMCAKTPFLTSCVKPFQKILAKTSHLAYLHGERLYRLPPTSFMEKKK